MLSLQDIAFRKRSALAGLVVAVQLMVVAAIVVPVFAVRSAQAQSSTAAPTMTGPKPTVCFTRFECLGEMSDASCVGDRCFEARPDACADGGGGCYLNPPAIPLSVHIGGRKSVYNIGDWIATAFNFGVGIVGFLAAIMFMIGGFQYLTAGESDRIAKAKKRITDALTGLVLLLIAYALLNTINPDLLRLQMPKIQIVEKKPFAACELTEECIPCGVEYYVLADRGTGATATVEGQCEYAVQKDSFGPLLGAGKIVAGECVGRGCGSKLIPRTGSEPMCGDLTFSCVTAQPGEKFQCGHSPQPAQPGLGDTSNGYICKTCKAEGVSCSTPGSDASCCGGYCADTANGNVCSSGSVGDACDEDSQCKTGLCQRNWGNSCSDGEVGSPCADNRECKNGNRCQTSGSNTCSPGTDFSYCDDDSECKSRNCVKLAGYENVCMPKSVPDERAAFKQAVCPLRNGDISDDCCNTNADCSGRGGFCNTEANNFCTDGSAGAPCEKDDQCQSNICADDTCTSGDYGSKCEDDNDCRIPGVEGPGNCYTGGDFNVCVSGGKGSRCDDVSDCAKGMKCDQHRCVSESDPDAAVVPPSAQNPDVRRPLF